MAAYIHPTAEVHPTAMVGDGAKIWNWVQVREHARIGPGCVISKGVYVDAEVTIGSNCKIQNHVSLFHGVMLDDGVFVGPHVCFTNDLAPRAVNPDGSPKGAHDWQVTPIRVRAGASIGANATILPGVTVGRFALVGAGAVVTKDVADHALVVGNPARVVGEVCFCARRISASAPCGRCGFTPTG